MKKQQIFKFSVILSLVFLLLCVASCEKHDGISYNKSKCEAELNGKYLIDQTKFDWGLNPNRTPSLNVSDYHVVFKSSLSSERGGEPLYSVYIEIYVNTPWEYLTKPQTIEFVNIGDSDEEPTGWDYTMYCIDNKISYATILSSEYEIVKDGSFQIISYDKERGTYHGKFTLQFSEGILNGEFTNN